jgi:hypothetical protein
MSSATSRREISSDPPIGPEFLGRFVEGVKAGKFDVTFRLEFIFPTKPAMVTVHLRNSYFDDAVWILIDWSDDGNAEHEPRSVSQV